MSARIVEETELKGDRDRTDGSPGYLALNQSRLSAISTLKGGLNL